MAELLIKKTSVTHADPVKDLRGCYKRGMVVAVRPDGHHYSATMLDKFAVIKVPHVAESKVLKYISPHTVDVAGEPTQIRRRLWVIRWADLPAAAKTKLRDNNGLTIKARDTYTGDYDYTWAQIKNYFRNQFTTTDETEAI